MFEGYTRQYRSENLDWGLSDKVISIANWRWARREEITVEGAGLLRYRGRPMGIPVTDIPRDVHIEYHHNRNTYYFRERHVTALDQCYVPRDVAIAAPHFRLGNWGNFEEILIGCGALVLDYGLSSVVAGEQGVTGALVEFEDWNQLVRRLLEALKRPQGLKDEIVTMGMDVASVVMRDLYLNEGTGMFPELKFVVGGLSVRWNMNARVNTFEGGLTGIRTGTALWRREEMASKVTAHSLADNGMEEDTSAASQFHGWWYDTGMQVATDTRAGTVLSGIDCVSARAHIRTKSYPRMEVGGTMAWRCSSGRLFEAVSIPSWNVPGIGLPRLAIGWGIAAYRRDFEHGRITRLLLQSVMQMFVSNNEPEMGLWSFVGPARIATWHSSWERYHRVFRLGPP